MNSRSSSVLTVGRPFRSKMVLSEPSATYKSPKFEASLKNAMWPLCSRSKHPLTNTFFVIPNIPPREQCYAMKLIVENYCICRSCSFQNKRKALSSLDDTFFQDDVSI